MTNEELLKLMDEGVAEACKLLVDRVKSGKASASDITQLRQLHREAGGSLMFAGERTPVGDSVLESMSDVDQAMLN